MLPLRVHLRKKRTEFHTEEPTKGKLQSSKDKNRSPKSIGKVNQ